MSRLTKTTDDLQADFDQLREDMAALMKTVSRMADNGQREGLAKIKNVGTAATDSARQGLEKAESTIVQNPLTSVLIAFGSGLLIGKLFSRE
ncbi:MAG: hypothetical protein K0Q64_2142 [Nitrobacter vulgaris]|jgi:ElaB/YqjD/DUF883 family membrane-anchored ribosome-binding protein|nr:hypothetical protein [Nitrobacter vulgaris]